MNDFWCRDNIKLKGFVKRTFLLTQRAKILYLRALIKLVKFFKSRYSLFIFTEKFLF